MERLRRRRRLHRATPDRRRGARPGHAGAERGARPRHVALRPQRLSPDAVDLGLPGLALLSALLVMCFASGRPGRAPRGARSGAARSGALAAGVQISLVAFAVAAMFHPIAYQFYFFCVAGLAGRRSRTPATAKPTVQRDTEPDMKHPDSEGRADAAVRRHREPVHDAGARLDPGRFDARVRVPAPLGAVRRRDRPTRHPAARVPDLDVPQRRRAGAAGPAGAAHRAPAASTSCTPTTSTATSSRFRRPGWPARRSSSRRFAIAGPT